MKRRRELMEEKSEMKCAIEELSMMAKDRASKDNKAKAGDDQEEAALVQVQEKDTKIPTRPFLSLCNFFLQILDEIGPTMTALRQDIDQNIQRLEMLQETDPSLYSNMVVILKKEASEGTVRKSTSCSKAILWLTRSLDFTVELLQRIASDQVQNIETAVEESYNLTLRPWHGWISTAAFKVAIKLVPDDQSFLSVIKGKCQDQSDSFKEDLKTLISLLKPFLDEIHSILKWYDLDRLKAT